MIDRVVYESVEIKFSPGINVFLSDKQSVLEAVRDKILSGVTIFNDIIWAGFPECKYHPSQIKSWVEMILKEHRDGHQAFIFTNSYIVLKEFDLQIKSGDQIMFHSLYMKNDKFYCNSTSNYLQVEPNPISEIFLDLFERDMNRTLEEDKE